MNRKRKHRPERSEAKVLFLLDLSEEDLQAIDGHPTVKRASKQTRKALEAITGWADAKAGRHSEKQFKLAVAFEDALDQLKEAYISATLKWGQLHAVSRRASLQTDSRHANQACEVNEFPSDEGPSSQ